MNEPIIFHIKLQEFLLNNHLGEEICHKLKYIQSIIVNLFINYSQEDKSIILNSNNEKFYSYQKNIIAYILCENEQKNAYYKYKTIIMSQCLHVLDEIIIIWISIILNLMNKILQKKTSYL